MDKHNALYQSTFDEAVERLRKYCAYQERCHKEVKSKAIRIKLSGSQIDEAISILIAENFLNEERFAMAWVGGKVRAKKWGINKICQGLREKNISDYVVCQSLSQYTDEQQEANLQYWFDKRMLMIKHESNPYSKKQKLVSFLLQKGFEYPHIDKFLANKLID